MRLTTDNPEGNYTTALNLFYIKDRETWVRGGGPAPDYPDVSLYDYIRRAITRHHAGGFDLGASKEDLDDALFEALSDGIDTKEGLIAMLYEAAWAFSIIRHKLKAYEDAGTPVIFEDEVETIDRAIIEYGENAQIDMAIEEMSELTKALCKFKRTGGSSPESAAVKGNIREEMADVYVMLAQLVRIFGGADDIQEEVYAKMMRLKDRLDCRKEASE